jgi:hypothetical protein
MQALLRVFEFKDATSPAASDTRRRGGGTPADPIATEYDDARTERIVRRMLMQESRLHRPNNLAKVNVPQELSDVTKKLIFSPSGKAPNAAMKPSASPPMCHEPPHLPKAETTTTTYEAKPQASKSDAKRHERTKGPSVSNGSAQIGLRSPSLSPAPREQVQQQMKKLTAYDRHLNPEGWPVA